jgi:hypothetical protein
MMAGERDDRPRGGRERPGGTALYERDRRGRQPPGRCKRLMRERKRDANDCEENEGESKWMIIAIEDSIRRLIRTPMI